MGDNIGGADNDARRFPLQRVLFACDTCTVYLMLFVSLSLSLQRPVLSARYLFPRFRNEGNSVEASGTMKHLLLVAGVAAILVLTFEVTEASSESDSRNGSSETTPTLREKRSPQDGPPKCPPPPMGPNGMPHPPPPDGRPPCGPPPNMDSASSGDDTSQMRTKRFARGQQSDGEQGGGGGGGAGGFGGGMGGGFGEAMANGMQTMTKAMGDMAKTAGNMMGGAMPGMG